MSGTYNDIQEYVRTNYGRTVKSCWIAEIKRAYGLTKRQSPNRADPDAVKYPCPAEHRPKIEEALRHFGLIS